MGSASELKTITEERTEISVEKEDVTLYECPCCEQTVDEDELANVDVGGESTAICDYCAESLFDISIEGSDKFDPVAAAGNGVDTVTDKLLIPLARLAIWLFPVGFGIYLASNLVDSIFDAQTAFLEASETAMGIMPTGLAPLVPLLILVWIALSTAPPRM